MATPPDDPDDMISLDQPATRRDLLELRRDLRDELRSEISQLHTHFDVVAESFRADFRNLFDWTQATTTSLGGRLDVVERDHGQGLRDLDLRVRALEREKRRS